MNYAWQPQNVFGYGSLARLASTGLSRAVSSQGVVTDLMGFARTWTTAMDNSENIPGYKFYVSASDPGDRPEVAVTFLDITPKQGSSVNGVCLPFTAGQLTVLDARERNYVRADVTQMLSVKPPGTVWAYVGSGEGRGRASSARRRGTAVIHAEYLQRVRQCFAAMGANELRIFDETTQRPDIPLLSLERIDIAG